MTILQDSPAPRPTDQPPQAAPISPRLWVVALGLLLVIGNAYWMRQTADVKAASLGFTQFGLFPNVIALLFLFVSVNGLIAKRWPRWALRPQELLTLYIMLAIATSVCAYDFLYYLPPMLAYGKWTMVENERWAVLFKDAFPAHLVVSDWKAVRGYFTGQSSLYHTDYLLPWLTPALWWLLFLSAVLVAMLCLNKLLLPRWALEEKLAFPFAAPPQMMTAETGSLLTDRLFWLALAASLGIDVINLLHQISPLIPGMPLMWDLTPALGQVFPWSAQRYLWLGLTPLVFGLSFLAPRDLCMSLWLFNILWRIAAILGVQYGLSQGPAGGIGSGFPYYSEQALGGCVALVATVLWMGRHYLKRVAACILGVGVKQEEARSFRLAVAGLVGAGILLILFSLLAGVSLWAAVAFMGLYFITAVATTRLRVQLGPPSVELTAAGPDLLLTGVVGTARLTRKELGLFTLLTPLTFSTRSTPMGLQMEGLYLFSRARLRGQNGLLLVSGLVGAAAALWAALDIGYRLGIGGAKATPWATRQLGFAFGYLSSWIENPTTGNATILKAFTVGAVITIALALATGRWAGWPLHPVGFVLSGAYAIHWMLPAIFAAWLTKTLVMRYGGIRVHRRALRLSLGLIIGSSLGSMLSVFIPLQG